MKKWLLCFCLILFSFSLVESQETSDRRPVAVTTIEPNVDGTPKIFRPFVRGFNWLFRRKKTIICSDGFANVTDLTLSQPRVTLNCPTEQNLCRDERQSIEVTTQAVDPENDVLVYDYKVTGGKIVGTGAKVVWDLSYMQPGTYTITAGVSDGCGICGKTITKEIAVVRCGDGCGLGDLVCPVVTITASEEIGIEEGDTVTFTAELSGANSSVTTNFKWSVTAGEIISGQNTSTVIVKATRGTAGKSITAVVDIGIPCLGLDGNTKTIYVMKN